MEEMQIEMWNDMGNMEEMQVIVKIFGKYRRNWKDMKNMEEK